MHLGPPRSLLALAAPPLCGVCGSACDAAAPLCAACERELSDAGPVFGTGPPGVNLAVAAAPYEGAARELAHALKYGRLLALAEVCAGLIVAACPAHELAGSVVPVPPSGRRWRWRGFDPAEEIALALAKRTGLPAHACLRRLPGPRQVGRPRRERLSDPPRVELRGHAPRSALLIDDVHTTGATLAACAAALRGGGSRRVVALTLARSGAPIRAQPPA
ncbi:MAG: hypothetical protein M3O25_03350 [Actinomycetota bacterium]|nr:hypothetical protein [Actinomycetota bacterium]